MSNGLVEYFGDLPDPRVRGSTDYPLIEIVFLCISAIVSGFDGWEAIEDFGHGKLDWLKKFLMFDAMFIKCRDDERVVSRAALTIAISMRQK